ncbi:MAG: GNAT family N-acetyltransferase [Oscillospiraceae bacterium]|nr:GNAT family N-acetyltransferase [Oscillospiraceae bacterium]
MNIKPVLKRKKDYIDLLLLADEQESMVDKYLERGDMFVLDDNGVKAECVVTKESDGIYELKNIAVNPDYQRKGYGKKLIEFLLSHYTDCRVMLVGTGDCASTLRFYKNCGFTESHRIKNFFTDNYDHLMYEDGKQLIDMIYLKIER